MKYLTIILSLFFINCSSCKPVPDPVDPPDTDQCTPACEHLRALGCEEGTPLEDGTTCEQFCIETQDNGHWLNPTCVTTINSCDDIDSCGEQATE